VIPYGRQDLDEGDLAAVLEVLHSDWLTQGPAIPGFEAHLAATVGAPHATAVSNATAALHLACLALGLGPGDRLWTSPNTFVASANCARYCGAEVDFVDIDPRTYNMSPEALAEKLDRAHRQGELPKILVPVHFAGQPCDMAEIRQLADRYGVRIIEDASHAVGARYRDLPVGACQYGDITVFSFHPVKIITTGEGGMAVTRDPGLHARMQRLRSHGITRDPDEMPDATDGPWFYQQIELGFNYRLTDIQAALGISQLRRLEAFLARRRVIARRYDVGLTGLPLTLPFQASGRESALHLYPVLVEPEGTPLSRDALYERLRAAGIGVNVHYIPVHTQPYYQRLGFRRGDFPEAERYYARAISLPMFPALRDEDQDRVIETLHAVLGGYPDSRG